MTQFSGYVIGALQVGLTSVMIKPKRGIFNPKLADGTLLNDILAQATVEERHVDHLEITEHPIEQGAAITDHAYKRPPEVILHLGWSNSPTSGSGLISAAVGSAATASSAITTVVGAANLVTGGFNLGQSLFSGAGVDQISAIYQSLLILQESRALFTLYTGKRAYTNMICKSLATETNAAMANLLPITMVCQQVLLVNTQTVTLPASAQKNAAETASPINRGTVTPEPSNTVVQ